MIKLKILVVSISLITLSGCTGKKDSGSDIDSQIKSLATMQTYNGMRVLWLQKYTDFQYYYNNNYQEPPHMDDSTNLLNVLNGRYKDETNQKGLLKVEFSKGSNEKESEFENLWNKYCNDEMKVLDTWFHNHDTYDSPDIPKVSK